MSDNAGPGEGATSTAKTKILNAYVNKGHYLCAGIAWNCFGSSVIFIGESQGRKAAQTCAGSPSDCGWNQDFRAPNNKIHNFDWPTACTSIGEAYWVPDQFFVAWLSNQWLGQARSNITFAVDLGYVQYFRYGLMISATYGGTPYLISSSSHPACNTP